PANGPGSRPAATAASTASAASRARPSSTWTKAPRRPLPASTAARASSSTSTARRSPRRTASAISTALASIATLPWSAPADEHTRAPGVQNLRLMPERTRRLPKLLSAPMWVLGLVVLVDEIDKNIVRGLIDPLKDEFGVGDFAIGVLLSMQLLFNGVITVPAGYLADRWNRSRAIGTTVIAWSVLSAAGAGAFGFAMLVGLRSVLGFGQAVSEPSAASLVGDYYPPERRGKAFSIQMAMLFVGTGIGVALGGWLGLALGWRWALVVVALPGLAVAGLVFRLREPRRGTADLMAAVGGGEIEHAGRDDHARLFENGFGQFVRDMVDGLRADMRTVLRIRTMRYALVGVAALLFTVTAISSWLAQYYIRHLHVAEGDG